WSATGHLGRQPAIQHRQDPGRWLQCPPLHLVGRRPHTSNRQGCGRWCRGLIPGLWCALHQYRSAACWPAGTEVCAVRRQRGRAPRFRARSDRSPDRQYRARADGYSAFADKMLFSGLREAQRGIAQEMYPDSVVVRDVVPTKLHTTVVYENWLRGVFGSAESPQAKEYGRRLLDSLAFTWAETTRGDDAKPSVIKAKNAEFKK